METFKVLKFRSPISIQNLSTFPPKNCKMRLKVPLVKFKMIKHNIVSKSAGIWNDISPERFEKCVPLVKGLLIPSSAKKSH
jgi:hypothetical protein